MTQQPATIEHMHDIIFAGGGLASCLTAYKMVQSEPGLDVLVVERGATLGGNHTWSMFASDVPPTDLEWLTPFIVHRWPSYEVRFPGFKRRLGSGYCSVTSDRLHDVMLDVLGPHRVRLASDVQSLDQEGLTLADGERLEAACVVDGRGPEPSNRLHLGFQKFTGRVVRIAEPHGLAGPIIMDATVPQNDDYRFVYVLPTAANELLIEDTRYSDVPSLESDVDRAAIDAYAQAQGWQILTVVREESGILPITLGGDIHGYWQDGDALPRIGLRAALFHATTGYSLPDAIRLASAMASQTDWTTAGLRAYVEARSLAHWREQRFLRFLNRMLFLAAEPNRRYRVMRRFYGLPEALIERFYAGAPSLFDRIRILTGKPPVAILPALRCLTEASSARILERQKD